MWRRGSGDGLLFLGIFFSAAHFVGVERRGRKGDEVKTLDCSLTRLITSSYSLPFARIEKGKE